VFSSTSRLAPFVIPLLLEKLSSSVTDAKRDAMQTLEACLPVYASGQDRELAPFVPALIAALSHEVLTSLQPAGPGWSVAAALNFGPSNALWTQHVGGLKMNGPISASATPIGLNFTGDPRAHEASGVGLYSPVMRALHLPGSGNASPSAIEEDAKLPLVEVALHSVASLARVLSQQAQVCGT
jgi:hypothetical protein